MSGLRELGAFAPESKCHSDREHSRRIGLFGACVHGLSLWAMGSAVMQGCSTTCASGGGSPAKLERDASLDCDSVDDRTWFGSLKFAHIS